MAFTKKEWKDRVSQYPNRRTINDGFQTKIVTVGRSEGSVTEAGDSFNAANMNDLENRINEAFTNIVHMPRVNDKAPYQYRQTPVKANRSYEKLIGCSCEFNQLVDISNINQTATYSDVTFTNNNDGTITVSGTASGDDWAYITGSMVVENNHIFALGGNDILPLSDGYETNGKRIVRYDHGTSLSLYARLHSGVTYNTTISVMCIDLTTLFGSSEVADYLYNLENS